MATIVAAEAAVLECCSCRSFAAAVAAQGPYISVDELIDAARAVWWQQTPVTGWLEAFAAHPRIGDLDGLRKKYGAFADMSKGEQAAAAGASDAVLLELANWNQKYEAKFGHIFIICASGKSAEEMLAAIQQRYPNPPPVELSNAAVEQQKITELRLRRTFGGEGSAAEAAAAVAAAAPQADRRAGRLLAQLAPQAADAPPARSPITTHVLDTCLGRPAPGVRITLARTAPGSGGAAWEPVAAGQTNADGRIGDLLPPGSRAQPGHYRITFDTAEYMARCAGEHPAFFTAPSPATAPEGAPAARRWFYPSVTVDFEIQPHQTKEHFHVPLTWNPFGYSTYRGS